jgi:plastocyanin domain-containing protein
LDAAQITVTVGGAALIAFILWFFFGPKKTTSARDGGTGVQAVEVVVRGGYTPDRIEVQEGRPVRLTFRREESTPCTEQVIIGEFGISRMLPQGERVPVEFTPDRPGEFTFHCGMNMVRGTLIVRPAGRFDSTGPAPVADSIESKHTH